MDIKLNNNNKLRLAPSITQLEYIESTGTQWIDTGFKAIGGNKQIYTYAITDAPTNWGCIVGSEDASSPYNRNVIILKYDLTTWEPGYGESYTTINYPIILNSIHTNEVKISSNEVYFKIDSTTVLTSLGAIINPTTNISIFRLQKGIYPVCARLYALKLYNASNILVRDFIPVKDNNNVVCLYDMVSGTFFYNQGTGDFVAGPEIPLDPKLTYLIPDISIKTTTLFQKNTPNINGYSLLNNILKAQENNHDIVLNRVRIDIGTIYGSLGKLLQYSSFHGFNDNYEPQDKPRYVGTWIINNYYTQDQLSTARSIFDGLTIIEDPNYLINFSQLAVQTLNPNEINYNPAVAIVLNNQNRGVKLDFPVVSGGGTWLLTKAQAQNITSVGNWFRNISSIVDTFGIVSSDTTRSYNLEYFNEFQYFTGITSLVSATGSNDYIGPMTMPLLKRITLPTTLVTFEVQAYGESSTFARCSSLEEIDISNIESYGRAAFWGCTSLRRVILPNNLTAIPGQTFCRCTNLREIVGINNITVISYAAFADADYPGELPITVERLEGGTYSGAFTRCTFTFREIPATCTYLGTNLFMETGTPYLHLLGEIPPQVASQFFYNQNDVGKIYVGKSYKEKSRRIYETYLNNSSWSGFSNKLGDWYESAAPQISYDGSDVTMVVIRTSEIYYTLDGSTPTTSSTKYTGSFTWNGSGVIKAMAIDSSNVIAYADDFYATTVQNPVITYTNSQITISSESGSTVYYTLDGTCPTLESSVYSGQIPITQEMGDFVKVRCFARVSNKNNSNIVAKVCVIDNTLWGTDGDTSYFAVQCIDSTKPNYNPAVCIILDNNNKLTDKLIGGGGGYLTKTGAAAITSVSTWFKDVITAKDNKGIVNSDITSTYDFEYFNEIDYFTSITQIEGQQFSGCSRLKSISFKNITTIGFSAFMGCLALEIELSVPNLVSISGYAFGGNASAGNGAGIKKIIDLGSITSIPNECFQGCRKLESVVLNNDVTTLGDSAFNSCYSLKNITISSNLTSIGIACFNSCGDLELDFTNLPQTITSIGARSFSLCQKISGNLNLPNLTNLEDGVFLGNAAQQNGAGIQQILNLGNITSLGNEVCYACYRLTYVVIPPTVTSIGSACFASARQLNVVKIEPSNPPSISANTFNDIKSTCKFYVGDGSSAAHDDAILTDYLADTNWSTYSSRLDTWYNYLHP